MYMGTIIPYIPDIHRIYTNYYMGTPCQEEKLLPDDPQGFIGCFSPNFQGNFGLTNPSM